MNSTGRASPSGLSAEQAARQLALDGPNELPRPPRRTAWHILLEVAREPMFQLLATAVAIYFMLGDRAEASVLLAFLGVIVAITLAQERRTERVLEALRDMTSPRALVWRDGVPDRIAGRELVRGDLMMIAQSLLQGCVILLLVGGFYGWLLHGGLSDDMARASAFIALIASNIALILANRSLRGSIRAVFQRGNRALWGIILTILTLLSAVLLVAPVRRPFGFALPDLTLIGCALGVGAVTLMTLLAQQGLLAAVSHSRGSRATGP